MTRESEVNDIGVKEAGAATDLVALGQEADHLQVTEKVEGENEVGVGGGCCT